MLNPWTLLEDPPKYRENSTMAITIRNEAFERHTEKLKKRDARREAFKRFFKRS